MDEWMDDMGLRFSQIFCNFPGHKFGSEGWSQLQDWVALMASGHQLGITVTAICGSNTWQPIETLLNCNRFSRIFLCTADLVSQIKKC